MIVHTKHNVVRRVAKNNYLDRSPSIPGNALLDDDGNPLTDDDGNILTDDT